MASQKSTRPILLTILTGTVIIARGFELGLAIGLRDDDNDNDACPTTPAQEEFKSSTGTYEHAAVATDTETCAVMAKDIMARKGGNAIDAAVIGLLCTGVASPHFSGIGGGSFITVYHSPSKKWHAVDCRETAPGHATEDMFAARGDEDKSILGGLAIGVPGEVKGLWELHNKFGRLPWKDVVLPVAQMCEDGVPMSKVLHDMTVIRAEPLENKQGFDVFLDSSNKSKPAGSIIKRPKLAITLRVIANDPFSFYNGSLAEDVVKDVTDRGGIITLDDLSNYKVKWSTPTRLELPNGYIVYSTPPPGSGAVLSYILNILSGYNMSHTSVDTVVKEVLTYHRIIEAFKFAFAKRSQLGDDAFVDVADLVKNLTSSDYGEATRLRISDSQTRDTAYYNPAFCNVSDAGTTHLAVVDGEGSAVSATGTINTLFGSTVIGSRTGIIFNNEMDDFCTPNTTNYFGVPASAPNFIVPGKRPMSSMCPVIVWDEKNKRVRLVTGGAGGTEITTATALEIIETIWLGMSLPASMDRPRLHHQLLPPELQLEENFPETLKEGLATKGHRFRNHSIKSILQAVEQTTEGLVATSDFRKEGKASGF